ncbi:MAG: hypothetical protein ABIH26_09420 [Candidatus Eisenbacteria bacterium]
MSRFPLRQSAFVLALWHVWSERERGKWMSIEETLRADLGEDPPSFQERGPSYARGEDRGALLADCAELRRRSSEQMWKACKENDITYLHFLQPNQHLPGTKRLTDWETRYAVAAPGFPHRSAVEEGYLLLLSAGEELSREGVPFTDLTGIFRDVEETVFADACCHYNEEGNDMIARRIARAIRDSGTR